MIYLMGSKGVRILGGNDMKLIGEKAKKAAIEIRTLSEERKNKVLSDLKHKLNQSKGYLISENKKDLEQAGYNDRLMINESRIDSLVNSIDTVLNLATPVGNVSEYKKMANGLEIRKMITPLGVVGIIYEARPNVTLDGFLLCFKTNNVCVLRGGKEAINSNIAIVKLIKEVLRENNLNEDVVQLIEDTSRQSALELMQLKALDVLIPRGGSGLIQSVVENAKVPIIETGVGNCHIYVDEFADIQMALRIAKNAKMSRISVCNSVETILVHTEHAFEFLRKFQAENECTIYGCDKTRLVIDCEQATEVEYSTEFLDYKVAIKVVDSYEEAVKHINYYSTNHSEAIITNDFKRSQSFLKDIDSACVYVNASTRFSDGFEFGMGAEIGISTQKLHARGPMGLDALTSYKYIINGQGQIRG